MTEMDNLEVGENTQNETPETQDNSHADKIERYKQQMEGSKAEAKRQHDMWLDREIKRASQDASSLLELHDVDPKLADEVAKSFGYENFAEAKPIIDEKINANSGVAKTDNADFEEKFERLYQERKAKETHSEAVEKANSILGKIKNEDLQAEAKKKFESMTAGKTLTLNEAEEIANMITLFVNKDNLKSQKYDDGLVNYASTGMGIGKKPASTEDSKVAVVRNGKIVYLDTNN